MSKKIPKIISIVIAILFLFSMSSCNVKETKIVEEVAEESKEEVKEEIEESEEEITIEPEEYEEIDKLSNVLQKGSKALVGIAWTVETEDISGNSVGAEALNTGMIYSDDGYILTNNIGFENIKEIIVTLLDGTKLPGDLLGVDNNTGVSVIKTDAQNLESLDFIIAEDINVGEAVISISKTPTGETNFSQGFVTATGQDMNMSQDSPSLVDLIKTDIEVEKGAVGGFLVNMDGEVIGINIVMTQSGDRFYIPSSIATNIADQIIEYGRVRIPFIGIEMGQNDTDISGVLVSGLLEDSPASKSGIEVGDIIVEFDGVVVKDSYQLLGQILRKNVGDLVQLKIYRNGDYIDSDIILAEKPSEQEYPDPIGYVNDFADVIDKEYEDKINILIKDLEEKTTAEIAAATIESLELKTIDEYSFELFNKWGIGKKDKNNGVLLLIVVNEKSVRIEVGLGLEDIITSDIAQQIIDELIIPNFQENNFNQGVYYGVEKLAGYIESAY
jgi:S1-C subfamily serine protease